ncbi:BadF/BadG/BcrA/BcrD ATPase family protein [Amaricoccus sp.]|uniref:BadF/BadG/BcrA/BcrD ATPase family protein n=1 Tax=Amaricoccus sp. TaxID=1872485 RepID=UPI001B60951E|nr:BadF/BadG/BcrA/BcrD ATPase family protein [Amaricoccus sp.]MBP7241807.1 ATPase [Amaricoccus sp.]
MTLYLGIDGGGTGCRAAVADASGRVLGEGAGGAANIFSDPDGARASVVAAAGAALVAAGLGSGLGDLVAALGLAGANVRGRAERLAEGLPFARSRVVSDALISARGALGAEDGVIAAMGTGSVFAAQRGGEVRTIGGWGFLLGDQGSGARLGRSLCEAALLAHDGLAPGSPLLASVLAEAGGPEQLVAWAQGARPADFAAFAPRMIAAEGDAGAAAILDAAVTDAAAAIDLLLAPGPGIVCFLGGLGPYYAARLADRYGALVRPAQGSALDGALALARELG